MNELMIAVRAFHFVAAVLLFGTFAFLVSVARAVFRGASQPMREEQFKLHRRLVQIAAWSLAAFFLSDLLWLAVQAATMSGAQLDSVLNRGTLGTVLGDTLFGRVWEIRLALAIVLTVVVTVFRRRADDRDWSIFGAWGVVLAGALLAMIAWAGHAAAERDANRYIHLSADAVHLLAAGGWVGALIPLVLLLSRANAASHERFKISVVAIRRFSGLGLVCVGGLLLTGIVNTWYLVGNVPVFLGTRYGQLLLVKIMLFAVMVTLAAINRLRLSPQLLAALDTARGASAAPVLRRLWRNAIIEIALGVTIVGIVGVLGVTIPAAHVQPVWPFPYTLSWKAAEESMGLQIAALLSGAGALIALACVLYGIRTRRWPMITKGLAGLGGALAASGWLLSVPAHPSTYFQSPLRYTAASIARGASRYAEYCAVCHGPYGYGDGPTAAALSDKPANLTEHLLHYREGDLFWWLAHGIPGTPMSGFGDRMSEPQLWDVINFLRAQAEAEEGKTINGSVEPRRPIVAPDFTFQVEHRPQESLKEHRGRSIVLLVLYTLPESRVRLRALSESKPELERAGVRLVAIPENNATTTLMSAETQDVDASIMAEPNLNAVATYTMFRRVGSAGPVPPVPTHMEFLIDRQGYLRARWIRTTELDRDQIPELLRQVEVLNHEQPRPPAPEGHVH